jgi:hypothetical protein
MNRVELWFGRIGWLFITLCAVEGLTLTAYLAYRAEHESPITIPPCAVPKKGG